MAISLKKLSPALFPLLLGHAPASATSPSFDCSRAKSSDEKLICEDDHLAELDQAVAIAFKQALTTKKADTADVKTSAKERLDDRRACGAEQICILDAQVKAISLFGEMGSNVPVPPWIGEYRLNYAKVHPAVMDEKLPQMRGHCTRTQIASITGRFGETLKFPLSKDDEVSGTAVKYTNDIYQISYGYEEDVARSHIGDQVLLCLSSIPRNCPPGDNRGREYSATNLTSRTSWIMPDSQHMCGGP